MAVLRVRNDNNFKRFLTSGTSQTTNLICCIITLQYALLQGYMRVGYSPLYIIMNSWSYVIVVKYIDWHRGAAKVLRQHEERKPDTASLALWKSNQKMGHATYLLTTAWDKYIYNIFFKKPSIRISVANIDVTMCRIATCKDFPDNNYTIHFSHNDYFHLQKSDCSYYTNEKILIYMYACHAETT